MKWSKQKVLTGGNISRGLLALRYWRYEVHWLIRCTKSTALRLIMRTIKHDAINISYSSRWQFPYVWIESFLELSRRQNRKAIGKNRFFSLIYSGPSPRDLQQSQEIHFEENHVNHSKVECFMQWATYQKICSNLFVPQQSTPWVFSQSVGEPFHNVYSINKV